MNMAVTLHHGEEQIAKWLGEQRHAANKAAGTFQPTKGEDPLWLDVNGAGGEIAFCKLNNLWPDLTIRPRRGGHDCVSYFGLKVDVKTTHREDGQLLAVLGKSDLAPCDAYVLMVGRLPVYRWVGFALVEDLISKATVKDLGHGDTYALPQRLLRNIRLFQ